MQKIDACCTQDNSCERHALSFRSTLFPSVRSTGEEIFPVGNISARRIAARNCIICKVPLKVSLSQHTFLATFLRNKAAFVRSFIRSRTHHHYSQLRHSHDYTVYATRGTRICTFTYGCKTDYITHMHTHTPTH